ncbi:MAG: TSUP family transporter [Eubacteriales bacterium]
MAEKRLFPPDDCGWNEVFAIISSFSAFLVGIVTGTLSACGLGGGTLLLIYLVEVLKIEQNLAQGINLLFFLPAGFFALPKHIKGGFIEKKAVLSCIMGGLLMVCLGAYLANRVNTMILRKILGLLLLLVGVEGLLTKTKK